MSTFRATRGYDSALTLYVRDEDGRLDTSEVETVEIAISRYGVSGDLLATVEGSIPSLGKITATIPASVSEDDLGPGLFRMDTIADDVVLRTDVLEVV
jgi:hypothetical protein